ncbi:MAG: hypothetical protein H6710_23820 [Myxococcales bacterium]|nr:hypothetical protein [Myxococcales bacterium]MCB9705136.1 hypothetical protein [Myxococcales bacterium]
MRKPIASAPLHQKPFVERPSTDPEDARSGPRRGPSRIRTGLRAGSQMCNNALDEFCAEDL